MELKAESPFILFGGHFEARPEPQRDSPLEIALEEVEEHEAPSLGDLSTHRLLESSSSDLDSSCSDYSANDMNEYYRFESPSVSPSLGRDSPLETPSHEDFSAAILALNNLFQDSAPKMEPPTRQPTIPPVSRCLIQGFVSSYPTSERTKALQAVTDLTDDFEPWLLRAFEEEKKDKGMEGSGPVLKK